MIATLLVFVTSAWLGLTVAGPKPARAAPTPVLLAIATAAALLLKLHGSLALYLALFAFAALSSSLARVTGTAGGARPVVLSCCVAGLVAAAMFVLLTSTPVAGRDARWWFVIGLPVVLLLLLPAATAMQRRIARSAVPTRLRGRPIGLLADGLWALALLAPVSALAMRPGVWS